MPRMIDYLRRQPPQLPYAMKFGDRLIRGMNWEWLYPSPLRNRLLKDAPTIVVDNVAEFVYGNELEAPNRKYWDVKEIPDAAPLFPNFFVEWKQPQLEMRQKSKWIGCHFYLDEKQEIELHGDISRYAGHKWQMHADLYFWNEYKELGLGPMVHWYIPIAEKGMIETTAMSHDKRLSEDDIEWLKSFLICPLVTIAFLHTKIPVERKPPEPKLDKKYQQRHGLPLVRFYTLKFEPLKQRLLTEGKARETGISRAMGLCRGVWRTYIETAPMFGNPKLVGEFFIPAHWRGIEANGVIVKDYEVMEPRIESGHWGAKKRKALAKINQWAQDEVTLTKTVELGDDEEEEAS